MISLRSRKGAEKVMSVYWFFILVLVAGTIVYIVSILSAKPYDVREIESGIFSNQIADCITQNGKLKYDLNQDLKDNFLNICHLNLDTGDNNGQYYINLEFYNFQTSEKIDYGIEAGNPNIRDAFDLGSNSELIKFGRAFYFSSDKKGTPGEIIVRVNIIMDKSDKNV